MTLHSEFRYDALTIALVIMILAKAYELMMRGTK